MIKIHGRRCSFDYCNLHFIDNWNYLFLHTFCIIGIPPKSLLWRINHISYSFVQYSYAFCDILVFQFRTMMRHQLSQWYVLFSTGEMFGFKRNKMTFIKPPKMVVLCACVNLHNRKSRYVPLCTTHWYSSRHIIQFCKFYKNYFLWVSPYQPIQFACIQLYRTHKIHPSWHHIRWHTLTKYYQCHGQVCMATGLGGVWGIGMCVCVAYYVGLHMESDFQVGGRLPIIIQSYNYHN